MLFSSIVFLFYFLPVVLVVNYLLGFSRTLQNLWLLIASLFFYAWGEPVYVFLMLASIFANYFLGLIIGKSKEKDKPTRRWVVVACIINIGLLFVFKYLPFTLSNIYRMTGSALTAPKIALPIGISFFTFQALSYVLDVQMNKTKYEKSLFYVGLYIAFFPQLIAGPIVQYNTVAQQIRERRITMRMFSVGLCRFTAGLGKKILLSNNFAILADNIFNWSMIGQEFYEVPILMAWLGSISYSLQIYFDFSAYSDMAIGLGLMFGFRFDENFNYPYIAKSITEFWRRWHISLSSWFRDYVYFPLGGSRVQNRDKEIRNLFIVWVLTGLWHGAEWNFLLWGMWHFIFILAERFFGYHEKPGYNVLKHIYTIFIVVVGWTLFRVTNLFQAGRYFANLVGANSIPFSNDMTWMLFREYGIWLLLGVIFSMPVAQKINDMLLENTCKPLSILYSVLYPVAMLLLFAVSVAYLARGTYNPFIYFNF
ncbi:MAG: MBOAT family protein [Eubacteriales bacterium]|nr:MBOAT family protein [Eubacteriales bacterium]